MEQQVSHFDHFISRSGSNLLDGDKVFRFAGIHMPELHMIEDDAKGKTPQGGMFFKLPTHEEQENWIKAQVACGTRAQRIYVLAIEKVKSQELAEHKPVVHVLAPSEKGGEPRFNEEAMRVYDNMIALADKHQLRLILPFIDHWQWWGGREHLADFYDEPVDAVYDVHSQTFQAYLSIITQLISRKNTVTGRYYYEEKAIMAWESGNELDGTTEPFLAQVAAHVKGLAPNQLFMDGSFKTIHEYAITDENVDIISNHLYQFTDEPLLTTLAKNLQQVAGRKPYFVGEFGLLSQKEITDVMDAIAETDYQGHKVVGGFVWGGRGHRRDGGYYWHQEHTGVCSYHLPGFSIEGEANSEQAVVDHMRRAAALMQGLTEVPPLPIPDAPIMLPIDNVQDINWMGAAVGRYYDIFRSETASGPWVCVGENISDGHNFWNPETMSLFSDDIAQLCTGQTYYYCAKAKNESGTSPYSNVVSVTIK